MLNQKKPDDIGNKVLEMPGVETPLVASIRTGLTSKNDAIMHRLPIDYANRSVADAVNYLLEGELSDDNQSLAESVRRELNAKGSVVVINGQTARLFHKVGDYITDLEHNLPDGQTRAYKGLDIEISAVQQGGYF